MTLACPDCRAAFEERAAIHEYDGKASRWQAERLAASERCEKHRDGEDIKAQMSAWAFRKKAREQAMGTTKTKGMAA